MKKRLLRVAVVLSAACFAGAAEKSGLEFHGSMYSDLGIVQHYNEPGTDEFDFTGFSTLSLSFKNRNRRFGKVEGLLDLIIPYGTAGEQLSGLLPTESVSDSATRSMVSLFSLRGTPVLLDFRKLSLSFYLPFVDITIGRQIINFGKGTLFSPVDIFSTVDITDLDFRRSGSDIVTFRFPFGPLSGCDIVAGIPQFDNSYSGAIKIFGTLADFDLSLIGLHKDAGDSPFKTTETTAGFAFKGDIITGAYGEAVVHYDHDRKTEFFEGMFGLDYSIDDRWIFVGEYLYKEPGYNEYLWGNHTIFGSTQYVINDIMNLSASIIGNITDRRLIGTINYYYDILQNVDTHLYIQGIESEAGTSLNYMIRFDVQF
ncbi:MAG: hypothetical protein GF401_07840 [Chitinivibrionales bacterium]|nr:hypothetical protein [Chitinivibrionales bacterium]